MTTTKWKDITDPKELFSLNREEWEIEVWTELHDWRSWWGNAWEADWKFRARPAQPKMKKVKMLCWLAEGHHLEWLLDGEEGYAEQAGWIRIPAQDIEIEVPDDN